METAVSNDDPHGVKRATEDLMLLLVKILRLRHDEVAPLEEALCDYVRAHAAERASDALDFTFNRGDYRG